MTLPNLSRRAALAGLSAAALAPRGLAAAPAGLFAQAGGLDVSGETFATSGHSRAGLGAGTYRADELAQAIGRDHPRLCVRTADGRWFRLLAQTGAIEAEQAGALGDDGDARHNDQPALQAAIAYARAAGIGTVRLTLPAYAVWMPVRRSAVDAVAEDGNALIIAADQTLRLVGTGAARSLLRFRGPRGESFASAAAVQSVHGKPWRGCGIMLRTGRGKDRSSLALDHLRIATDYRRRPAGPAADLVWDITHKGIYTEADRLGGALSITDCSFAGWRGETVYTSNDPASRLYVRASEFTDSNAQGLNPMGLTVDVAGVTIRNCAWGIEGWTGASAGRIAATIEDCATALTLQGGKIGHSRRSAYYAPTRLGSADPVGTLDITCRNSGTIYLGSWLKGSLAALDSKVSIGDPGIFPDGSQGLDLDIQLARRTADVNVFIAGGQGSRGECLTDDLDLRLSVVTGSLPVPVLWYGSLGPRIRLNPGTSRQRLSFGAAAALSDHAPRIL